MTVIEHIEQTFREAERPLNDFEGHKRVRGCQGEPGKPLFSEYQAARRNLLADGIIRVVTNDEKGEAFSTYESTHR